MTRDELLAWGRQEDAIRKAEIAAGDIAMAQENLITRRRAVGLSATAAAMAVRDAQVAALRASRP